MYFIFSDRGVDLKDVSFVVRKTLGRGSNDHVVKVIEPNIKHFMTHCLRGQESIMVGSDLRFDKSTFKITSPSLFSDQLKQIAMSSKHKLISKVYVKFDVFGTKEDICDQSIKQANFFKTLAIRCTTLALSPECLHYLKEITNNKKIECSILEFKGLSNKNIQQYSSKGILEKLTFLMRNRPITLSEDTMSFLCLYFKNYKLMKEIIDLNAGNQRKGDADKLVKALSSSLDKQYQKQLVPAKNTIEEQAPISKKTPESKHKKKILKDKLVKATSDQQYQKQLVRAKSIADKQVPISEKRSTFEQKQKAKQTEGLVYHRHQNPSVEDWNYSGKPTQEKNEFNKNVKSLTLVVDMDESLIKILKEYETLDELTINTRSNNPDEIQSILKSLKNIKNVATLNISNTKCLQYIEHLSVDELNITQPSLDADDIQILSKFLCSNQSCTFSSLTDGLMLNTMKFSSKNSIEQVRSLLLKHSAQFRVSFVDVNYSDEYGNTFNGVDLKLNAEIPFELKQLLARITELNSLELNGGFLENLLPNLKTVQHIFIKKDSKWLRLLVQPFNLNSLSIKCDLAPKDILDLISLIDRRIIPFTEDDIASLPPKLVLSKATKIRFSKIKAERDSEKTEIEKLDNAVHTGDLFQTQEATTGVSFRQISKSDSSHIPQDELTGNFSSLQKQKHSDPHKTKKSQFM